MLERPYRICFKSFYIKKMRCFIIEIIETGYPSKSISYKVVNVQHKIEEARKEMRELQEKHKNKLLVLALEV